MQEHLLYYIDLADQASKEGGLSKLLQMLTSLVASVIKDLMSCPLPSMVRANCDSPLLLYMVLLRNSCITMNNIT